MLIKVKVWFNRVGGGESWGGGKYARQGGRQGKKSKWEEMEKEAPAAPSCAACTRNHCSTRRDCLAYRWEYRDPLPRLLLGWKHRFVWGRNVGVYGNLSRKGTWLLTWASINISTLLDPTQCNTVRLDVPETLRGEEKLCVCFFIFTVVLWMMIHVQETLGSLVEYKCAFVLCTSEQGKMSAGSLEG